MKRAEEVKNDVFPIVFLVFLCVSASPLHPFVVLREYCWTHMCNTVLHAWVCQKSERIFLSYVHFASIRSHAMTSSLFHDLSSCCKCHGHVNDMHVAWCIITWHPMNSSQHPPNIHYSPFGIQPNSTDHSHSPQTHLPWVKNEPLLKWIS